MTIKKSGIIAIENKDGYADLESWLWSLGYLVMPVILLMATTHPTHPMMLAGALLLGYFNGVPFINRNPVGFWVWAITYLALIVGSYWPI